MPHYKNIDGSVLYWLDSPDFLPLLPEEVIEIDGDEAEKLRLKILEDANRLSPEQILSIARSERDRLLTYATLRINPLQDDVDNEESTQESEALLKSWKQYRSAVSKVENKDGWPDSPQWPDPPVPLETSTDN